MVLTSFWSYRFDLVQFSSVYFVSCYTSVLVFWSLCFVLVCCLGFFFLLVSIFTWIVFHQLSTNPQNMSSLLTLTTPTEKLRKLVFQSKTYNNPTKKKSYPQWGFPLGNHTASIWSSLNFPYKLNQRDLKFIVLSRVSVKRHGIEIYWGIFFAIWNCTWTTMFKLAKCNQRFNVV